MSILNEDKLKKILDLIRYHDLSIEELKKVYEYTLRQTEPST